MTLALRDLFLFVVIAAGTLGAAGCAGDRPFFHTGIENEKAFGAPLPVLSFEPTKIDWAHGLTLDAAIRAAIERNPSLQTARLRIVSAEARGVTAAQPPFNPELEGEWTTGSAFGNNSNQRVAARLTQEFETGGQRGIRIQRSEVATQAVRFDVKDAERRLRESVTAAYYAAVQVRGLLGLAEEALTASKEFLALGDKRLAARAIPESEVIPLRLDVARAESEVLRRAKELAEAKRSLTALLGEDPRDDFDIAGELPASPSVSQPDAVLARRMLEARPDLAALRTRVEEAEQALRLEYAERSQNVRAGIGIEGERNEVQIGSNSDVNTDGFVSFSLTIPLPVYNKRAGQIEEGRAEIRIARAELDEKQRTAYADMVLARRRLDAAGERLAQQRGSVLPAAEASVKSARDAFEAGQTDATPVLLAQERRREVREQIEDLRFELAAARVALEAIVGTALDEPTGAVK